LVLKCPKRKTKKCWIGHCSLKRTSSSSLQWLFAYRLLKRTVICSVKNVTGSNPFSPKIPNFNLPNVQTRSKCCLQVFIHQKALKVTQNLKSKHHFNIIQQFNKVSPKLSTTTQFTSPIHNYEHPMHQFINNNIQSWNHSQFNNHNIILHQFCSNIKHIHIYTLQAYKFNINNTIIIQFTYLNIASKLDTNFYN